MDRQKFVKDELGWDAIVKLEGDTSSIKVDTSPVVVTLPEDISDEDFMGLMVHFQTVNTVFHSANVNEIKNLTGNRFQKELLNTMLDLYVEQKIKTTKPKYFEHFVAFNDKYEAEFLAQLDKYAWPVQLMMAVRVGLSGRTVELPKLIQPLYSELTPFFDRVLEAFKGNTLITDLVRLSREMTDTINLSRKNLTK